MQHPPARPNPWPIILGLMLAVVATRTWMISHTVLPARDAIGFARYALHLETPPTAARDPGKQLDRLGFVRDPDSVHPPGYPVCVLAASYPVRWAKGEVSPEVMILSAQLVSALSAIYLVIPFYFLARRVGGPTAALLASLAFELSPVFTSISSDGLSDGPFLALTLTGLWAGTVAVEPKRGWLALVAGLCTGCAYLFRPEGLMTLGTSGIVYLAFVFARRLSLRGAAGRYLLVCVGAAIMAGPYVAVIGKLTNKTTGNDLIEMMQGDREEPSWKPRVGEQSRNGGTALLAAWWTAEDGYQPKRLAARALASEVFKAGHYLFPLMGLYGVWLMWRTRRGDAAVAILLCAAGFNVLILLYLATKIGYVSERHALPIACYLTIFAGPVLARIAESIGRSRSPLFSRDPVIVTALLLALFCLPGALKPLHANREGLRRAGEWLAKNMKPDEHLIDPFDWSAYYSGRTLWGFDRTNIHEVGTYTILDMGPNSHSRLPVLPLAREVAKRGEVVFRWPEDAPKIQVYRTGPLPWPVPWSQ